METQEIRKYVVSYGISDEYGLDTGIYQDKTYNTLQDAKVALKEYFDSWLENDEWEEGHITWKDNNFCLKDNSDGFCVSAQITELLVEV